MRVKTYTAVLFLLGYHCAVFGSEPPKQRVELSTGITMTYVEIGKEDGEPVLLLHGFTDTKRSFYPVLGPLSKLRPDLRLLVPDQRGHGDSTMPPAAKCAAEPEQCFRIKDFAEDVIAFLDKKQIKRAHIVGHSLGSLVAQEVAISNPDRVNRIVLIASGARGIGNPVMQDFLFAAHVEGSWKKALIEKKYNFPADVYGLSLLDADPNGEKWLLENWVVDPLADPKFLAEILPETARIQMGVWIGFLRHFLQWDNSVPLKDLKAPALVIWATQDSIFPEQDQKLLLSSLDAASQRHKTKYYWKQYGKKPLPESGMQENDVGHNTHWGTPGAVAADVASFLRDNGEPIRNLPHASPDNPRQILNSPGDPVILESANN